MISNETVLNKMVEELKLAKQKHSQSEAVREHVRAVRSLCDLLLDEREVATETKTPTKSNVYEELELKKMMGDQAISTSSANKSQIKETPIKHEDGANGESIFDF